MADENPTPNRHSQPRHEQTVHFVPELSVKERSLSQRGTPLVSPLASPRGGFEPLNLFANRTSISASPLNSPRGQGSSHNLFVMRRTSSLGEFVRGHLGSSIDDRDSAHLEAILVGLAQLAWQMPSNLRAFDVFSSLVHLQSEEFNFRETYLSQVDPVVEYMFDLCEALREIDCTCSFCQVDVSAHSLRSSLDWFRVLNYVNRSAPCCSNLEPILRLMRYARPIRQRVQSRLLLVSTGGIFGSSLSRLCLLNAQIWSPYIRSHLIDEPIFWSPSAIQLFDPHAAIANESALVQSIRDTCSREGGSRFYLKYLEQVSVDASYGMAWAGQASREKIVIHFVRGFV